MTLTPLALRSPAVVRDALVRRGMDATHADAAARGLAPVAVVFDEVSQDVCRILLEAAHRQGVESLTGDDWIVLAGSAAQLAGLARSGFSTLPEWVAEALGRTMRGVVEPPAGWLTARGRVSFERPLVVGILNLTPDSFSDGGRYLDPDAALRHAAALVEDGADMVDVGGESTRPGRPDPVPAVEEWRRLEPVLPELARRFPDTPLSVDTVKAEVARRALDGGAWVVNDVSALRLDSGIADVCAARGAGLILVHSRGSTQDMATYDQATYRDVATQVRTDLLQAVDRAVGRGVSREQIVLDPGLGFSKTPAQSYEALRGVPALAAEGFAVMVGPSRKRFLDPAARLDPAQRDHATAAACVAGYLLGAALFRVHNVRLAREAVDVAHAIGRA